MAVNHAALYKNRTRPTPIAKAKEEYHASQKRHRDALLRTKRVMFLCEEKQAATSIVDIPEKAISLAKELGKAATQERALASLVQFLSVSDEHVAEFIKIGGTLYRIAGVLSGHLPQHQLLAAQCITNMAASCHAERLLTPIGPYLIAFVSSPYLALKDYSAWALGNMAGDSPNCRRVLTLQGAIPSLVHALNSSDVGVVHSALFALRNFTYHQEEEVLSAVWESKLPLALKHTLPILVADLSHHTDALCEGLWLVSHLVHSRESVLTLSHSEVLTVVVTVFCGGEGQVEVDGRATAGSVQLLTACLRVIGNSVGWLPELVTTFCCWEKVVRQLEQLSRQDRISHLKKEALWVLANIQGHTKCCVSDGGRQLGVKLSPSN